MARACMFCGVEGNSSKEHVFPEWLLKEIKRAGFASPDERPVRKVFPDPEFDRYPTVKAGSSPLNPHGIDLTRKVCISCNNGWMGEGLERPFAKVFKALLRLDFASITEPEVKTLITRWAVKTSMVCDEALGSQLIYSAAERASFKDGYLPSNTDVCMTLLSDRGAYTGSDYTGVIPGQNPDGSDRFAWVNIIYAGPLIFLIRRATNGNDFLRFLGETQYFAESWIPLMSVLPYGPVKALHPVRDVQPFIDDPLRERRA